MIEATDTVFAKLSRDDITRDQLNADYIIVNLAIIYLDHTQNITILKYRITSCFPRQLNG